MEEVTKAKDISREVQMASDIAYRNWLNELYKYSPDTYWVEIFNFIRHRNIMKDFQIMLDNMKPEIENMMKDFDKPSIFWPVVGMIVGFIMCFVLPGAF